MTDLALSNFSSPNKIKKEYDCIYIEFTAELQYAKGKSALQLITV